MTRLIAALLSLVLLGAAFTGCSGDLREQMEEKLEEGQSSQEEGIGGEASGEETVSDPTASYGGTLRLVTGNPESFNPYVNTKRDVDVMLGFIYQKLFTQDSSYAPVPVLVDSFTYDADGKGILLTLSQTAHFSDGTPLSAEDVLQSYEMAKSLPGNIYSGMIQNIDRIIAVDASTVRVLFKQAYAFGLYDLAFPIVKKAEGQGTETIGTGPYAYAGSQAMKEVVLERNSYWQTGKPYIDSLHFTVAEDQDIQQDLYDQHLVDALHPSRFDWTKYSDDARNDIYEYPSLHYQFIAFSPRSAVFADTAARKALGQAIDKELLATNLYLDHAVAAGTPVPPEAWYNKQPDTGVAYAPDEAAAYFDTAAIGGTLRLIARTNTPSDMAVAGYLKNTLAEMAVAVEVEGLEDGAFTERLMGGDYDLAVSGWKMATTPDYSPLFHSAYAGSATNFINYSSGEMDALLASIYMSTSEDMLVEAVDRFQSFFAEELPYLSLFYLNGAVIVHDNVYGSLTPSAADVFGGFEALYLDNSN